MRVYVVMTGAYDQYGLRGVFATPELAMASCPGITKWKKDGNKKDGNRAWWSDESEDYAEIFEYEVSNTGDRPDA